MARGTRTAGRERGDEALPYADRARRYPPLARGEEHALALRARAGDVAAKQKLVRHTLAFVVAIARKQRRGTLRLDDLVQEGSLGLLRAVEKFDPDAGTRFITYASWWIRAYIGKHLKEARSAVRPRAGRVAACDLSLDSAVGDDDDTTHLDRLEDERPNPEDACASADADREIRDALGKVRGRIGELGWDIVQSRLAHDSPRTLEEIGNDWDVSRERVCQVEVRTKRFLRRYLEGFERKARAVA